MKNTDVEKIEIDLLLEAIYLRWGYDFRSYARASIERRTRQFLLESDSSSVTELIRRMLRDRAYFSRLVEHYSIVVSEFFRDPFFYQTIREQVIPLLRTWPHFKVWHAGCAGGEEAYSLAILLKEEGIYDRATIYATDFNEQALEQARKGIYTAKAMQNATRDYQRAGGMASFSDYYHASSDEATMDSALKERILFTSHNLVSDGAFGEMHLVFCRNVLIYFNVELRERVLGLINESLVSGGFLCLGIKENLQLTVLNKSYNYVDKKASIYKKCGPK